MESTGTPLHNFWNSARCIKKNLSNSRLWMLKKPEIQTKPTEADIRGYVGSSHRLRKGHSRTDNTLVILNLWNREPLKAEFTNFQQLIMQNFNSFQMMWTPEKPIHMDPHWLLFTARTEFLIAEFVLPYRLYFFPFSFPHRLWVRDPLSMNFPTVPELEMYVIRLVYVGPQNVEFPAGGPRIGRLCNLGSALFNWLMYMWCCFSLFPFGAVFYYWNFTFTT